MLFDGNAKIANRYFKKTLGILKEGAAADVIVVDYDPLTPMDASNCNGHLLFGVNGSMVRTTVCNGKVLMKDREVLACDEEKLWQTVVGLQKNLQMILTADVGNYLFFVLNFTGELNYERYYEKYSIWTADGMDIGRT